MPNPHKFKAILGLASIKVKRTIQSHARLPRNASIQAISLSFFALSLFTVSKTKP
jgi:hypothetical protein